MRPRAACSGGPGGGRHRRRSRRRTSRTAAAASAATPRRRRTPSGPEPLTGRERARRPAAPRARPSIGGHSDARRSWRSLWTAAGQRRPASPPPSSRRRSGSRSARVEPSGRPRRRPRRVLKALRDGHDQRAPCPAGQRSTRSPTPVTSAWRGSIWLGDIGSHPRRRAVGAPARRADRGPLVGEPQRGGGVGAAAAQPAGHRDALLDRHAQRRPRATRALAEARERTRRQVLALHARADAPSSGSPGAAVSSSASVERCEQRADLVEAVGARLARRRG